MHEDHTAAAAAREEGARQAVALCAMAVAIPLAVWLERRMSGPDATRQWRMRCAKAGERAAAQTAAAAWGWAERFRRAYEAEQPT
jgi:hypothetical protein